MSNYKIVASDLDGTLLNTKVQVSEENWEAVRQMTEAGVHFVPSSGRAFYEMPAFIRESPYVRYVIHSDGSAIYDKQTGESVRLSMSRERSHLLLDVLAEYENDASIRHCGRVYTDAATNTEEFHRYNRMDDGWVWHTFAYYEPTENFDQFCRDLDGIDMLCTFFHSADEQEICRKRLEGLGYHVVSSHPCNLEVYAPTAGKGSALLALAKRLGIAPDATIAVGDSPNDSDMIRKAGLGLAMGNACEELKAIAREVICTNDEHAMRYILNHYIR
ncbi:MAG: Cof-type HAD-IIB family hydrolase [Clostridia bacterium]|nr:Cof-type HAD-IIB family hydrolase [Clostridia bacterium]